MVSKARTKKSFQVGKVVINATFNNTVISITTPSGDVLCQSSSGRVGFKGSRKGTPFAAQVAAESVAREVREKYKMECVEVLVKGPGAGRDPAIRAIHNAGLTVKRLADVTPLPHNGCRPSKRRRV